MTPPGGPAGGGAMSLPGWTPLDEAKAWLRARLATGARCPCCDQRAQMYRRPIGAAMAALLIRAWRLHGTEPFHLPTLDGTRGGDASKLRYWGLLVEEGDSRPDGGRAGWWHVTARGAAFIAGDLAVPRYALVYDSRPFGLDGPAVTVRDALGTRFDYEALLRGDA